MPVTARGEANFSYLLAGIIGITLVSPLLGLASDTFGRFLWEVTVVVMLALSVWSLSHFRFWFLAGIGLAALEAAFTVVRVATGYDWPVYLMLASWFLFYALLLVFAVRAMFGSRTINLNQIIGAICVYLLAAYLWAILYTVIELALPGSFAGVAGGSTTGGLFAELTYFSFVTIASLGYGEITPLLPIARTLAMLEAVFGQFYIAVLVASLVGIRISQKYSA